MDGFKRPNKPVQQTYEQRIASQAPERPIDSVANDVPHDASVVDILKLDEPEQKTPPKKKRKLWKVLGLTFADTILLAALGGLLGWNWYNDQLKPADSSDNSDQQVQIVKSATFAYVAEKLEERGIIRNKTAFQLYAQISGKASAVKEGTCVVHKSQSSQEILDVLTKGCNEFKSITFYPGGTIEKPLYKPDHAQLDQTMYVKYVLAKAGYSESDIAKALSVNYDSPLFEGRPAGATLEGYVFGETYHVAPNATAEKVLQTSFDEMYKQISAEGLPDKFKAQGLDMFQAITLASIVQRELNCEGKNNPDGTRNEARTQRCYQYQRTIAQIFLKRLREDDVLGSDVTFIYAADMQGVFPTVNIDSPYNTRINKGLPPGPIAAPGLLALKAVGNPTDTDYHFFIAGDDGLIYFAKTVAEHEENIKNYCQKLCNEL